MQKFISNMNKTRGLKNQHWRMDVLKFAVHTLKKMNHLSQVRNARYLLKFILWGHYILRPVTDRCLTFTLWIPKISLLLRLQKIIGRCSRCILSGSNHHHKTSLSNLITRFSLLMSCNGLAGWCTLYVTAGASGAACINNITNAAAEGRCKVLMCACSKNKEATSRVCRD